MTENRGGGKKLWKRRTTIVIASQPPERRLTAMPTAHADFSIGCHNFLIISFHCIHFATCLLRGVIEDLMYKISELAKIEIC